MSKTHPLIRYAIILASISMFSWACDTSEMPSEDQTDESNAQLKLIDDEQDIEQQAFLLRSRGNYSVQQGEAHYLDSYLNASGESYGAIAGRGQLVRKRDRTLQSSVSIAGLPADTFFGGHLHRAPCSDDGGAHMQDPDECPLNSDGTNSCVATFPGNELWVGGTTDSTGRLVVQSSADWSIPYRSRGQKASKLSIIIHDTPNNGGSGAGPKMLCVDLSFDRTTKGRIGYVTPDLTDDDRSSSVHLRKAKIIRRANGKTTAQISWRGLRPDFKYPSHIHAARCTEVSNGGPHYVRDIECIDNEGNSAEGCEATADTEFWTGATSNRRGRLNVNVTIPHLARAGALALILHECLDANGQPALDGACASKPRFACVDFH
jgi:hypothetical protein